MKHSEDGKWTYDDNEEIFNNGEYFDTKEEAINGGKNEYIYEGEYPAFFVGQIKSVDFCLTVNSDDILENISQSVYDEVGEVAEDYLRHVKNEHQVELETSLTDVVRQWMDKYNYKPTFYRVINVESVSSNTNEK